MMKRFIILILLFCFAFSECDADDYTKQAILLCLLNGDYIRNTWIFTDDGEDWSMGRIPTELPEQCEVENGVLYDTDLKALLFISDEECTEKNLTVMPGTRYISSGALNLNHTIEEIILPDGLEVIGSESLTGHQGIDGVGGCVRKIYVPASVRLIQEPIGYSQMAWICAKPEFIVDKGNPRYISTEDGLLIDNLEKTILWCASFSDPRVVTVPDGIRRIAPYAFAMCTEIISVQLPETVTEIGEGAFCMMYSLKEITIPESVLKVGAWCFAWSGGEKWYLDTANHVVNYKSELDTPTITDEEALLHFGVERAPGIHFRGTEFLLCVSESCATNAESLYEYWYSGFEDCHLSVDCPDNALCLEFMELEEGLDLTVIKSETVEAADDAAWTCENGHAGNAGKFCIKCGAAKPIREDNLTKCPSCGYEFGETIPRFCTECGTKITK